MYLCHFWFEQRGTFFYLNSQECIANYLNCLVVSRVCWHFYEYFQQSRYLAKEIHKDRKKRWWWNDTDTLAPRTHTDCRSAPVGRVSKLLLDVDVVPWPAAAAARCSAQTTYQPVTPAPAPPQTAHARQQRNAPSPGAHCIYKLSFRKWLLHSFFSLLNAIWETINCISESII